LPDKYAKNIADVMTVNSDRQILLWVNEAGKDVSALSRLISDGADDATAAEATTKRLHVKQLEEYEDRFLNWDIIQKEPNVGARSDWIRMEVVYWYGGTYMDTDTFAHHAFSDYGGVFRWPFVAYSDPDGYGNLCNCVFSAEKESPMIKMAFEGWRETHLDESLNIPSGPPFGCGVMTSAFMTWNDPEILMIGEQYIFKAKDGVEPVLSQGFDASWVEKGMFDGGK